MRRPDDYWFQQRHDDALHAQAEGMTFPVRCRCGGVYDLGKVTVTARYADCSMWKAPCCGVTADDRKPPWGISWYKELPRRAPWRDSDDEAQAEGLAAADLDPDWPGHGDER